MKIQAGLSNLKKVEKFYLYLLDEVRYAGYNSQEISLLEDARLYYGRYLDPYLRNYFIQTVIPHISCAISFFSINNKSRQGIIDLGCGLGMQSILFAALGAKVVAIDIRGEAISLCKKRKAYYENRLKIDLDIEFFHRDFRLIQPEDFNSKFDCLFSMSAFSYITTLNNTARSISSILKSDSKIFLYEENTSKLLALIKESVVPGPEDTINALNREGFETCLLYGGCSLPSFCWKFPFLNRPILHPLNNFLRKRMSLSFNYVLGMERSST